MLLFVNASSKRDGNTTAMAERLLAGTGYETLHLIDYAIPPEAHRHPVTSGPRSGSACARRTCSHGELRSTGTA